jgi:hypothetical protein
MEFMYSCSLAYVFRYESLVAEMDQMIEVGCTVPSTPLTRDSAGGSTPNAAATGPGHKKRASMKGKSGRNVSAKFSSSKAGSLMTGAVVQEPVLSGCRL